MISAEDCDRGVDGQRDGRPGSQNAHSKRVERRQRIGEVKRGGPMHGGDRAEESRRSDQRVQRQALGGAWPKRCEGKQKKEGDDHSDSSARTC